MIQPQRPIHIFYCCLLQLLTQEMITLQIRSHIEYKYIYSCAHFIVEIGERINLALMTILVRFHDSW